MRHVNRSVVIEAYRPDTRHPGLGSLHFGDGHRAMCAKPNYLARALDFQDLGSQAGTRFSSTTGNLWFVPQAWKQGLLTSHTSFHCAGQSLSEYRGRVTTSWPWSIRARKCNWARSRYPHADAVGGAVGARRRQCCRRTSRPSLFEAVGVMPQRSSSLEARTIIAAMERGC